MGTEDAKTRGSSVFESANYLARKQAERLQARREVCMEKSNFREASRLQGELDAMTEEHEGMEAEKIRMRQLEEHLRLLKEQAAELDEFNATWQARLKEFQRRAEFLRSGFQRDQRDAHSAHLQEIRAQKPALKKSKHLMTLWGQANALAKMKKFDEADFIKMEAERYERKQLEIHKFECDKVSRLGGKEVFMKGQSAAKAGFDEKIELDWQRLNVAKRRETDELLKRQQAQRSRLNSKIARDSQQHVIQPLLAKDPGMKRSRGTKSARF